MEEGVSMAEDNKVSKAQQKAVNKYVKNNYDRINVTFPKGRKEKLREHAKKQNESVNAFIVRSVSETMERDNQIQEPTAAHAGSAQSRARQMDSVPLEDAAAKADLKRLPNDILYQMDIAKALGTDVLAKLLEKARQQPVGPKE